MAAAAAVALSLDPFSFTRNPLLLGQSSSPTTTASSLPFPFLLNHHYHGGSVSGHRRRNRSVTLYFSVEDEINSTAEKSASPSKQENDEILEIKLKSKRSERFTYLIAAVISSSGVAFMAIVSVYYRFYWQTEGREIPWSEMFGTFALSVGAAVGMEFWARWAHRALWHASLWHMHESHHRAREGAFEVNDIFAIINAVPAIALLSYGLFHRGLLPGLCFGAGLGITVFGIAYMFVHDGLVHKRFPVGPIANVPYLTRVAAAHQLHHSDKFKGVPFGLFMGPKELKEVGGHEELEKEVERINKYINT